MMMLTFDHDHTDHCRVSDGIQKENLGILVQYKIKVKLFLGSLGG